MYVLGLLIIILTTFGHPRLSPLGYIGIDSRREQKFFAGTIWH